MTGYLLHGIAAAGVEVPDGTEPHHCIEIGSLAGIATGLSDTTPRASETAPVEEALRHHRLLSAYAAVSTVLPVRFGTVLHARAGIATMLTRDADLWMETLTRLDGKVEYALNIGLNGAALDKLRDGFGSEPASGRGFLAGKRLIRDRRRSVVQSREAFLRNLHGALSGIVESLIVQSNTRRERLCAFALLVNRTSEPSLRGVAAAYAPEASRLGLHLSLVGPGPCYAFVPSGKEHVSKGLAESGDPTGRRADLRSA